MRGGARSNAGRKIGSKSTSTVDRLKKVQSIIASVEATLPDAFIGDAHAFLIAVYKDTKNPIKDRLAAATAAIGYEKPKLAAIEHSGDMAVTLHEQALVALEKKVNGIERHQ